MKKIAVLTTGGTIGSLLSSGSVSVETTESTIQKELGKAAERLDYSISLYPVFNKNSEHLTPLDWLTLLKKIREVDALGYHGIVITHGTDTMAYSLCAVLAYSHLWKTKICFTGSYYSPDHTNSDAPLSLLAALEFSASSQLNQGVFLAFRSNVENTEASILAALDVKEMNYDEECFYTSFNRKIASYSQTSGLSILEDYKIENLPNLCDSDLPSTEDIVEAIKRVNLIKTYPGINYKSVFNHSSMSEEDRIIILELYHSGTLPALNDSIKELPQNTKLLAGTFPSEKMQYPYSSTAEAIKSGVTIYKRLQPHFLYTYTLLALASKKTLEEIVQSIKSWEV